MIDKNNIVKNNKIIFYITYSILLSFVVFNYKTIFTVTKKILSLATPFYIAIVIAFILNIPMKKIEKIYSKKIEKKSLRRGLSIATTLIFALCLIILFSSFIIPRILESITLIITNIFNYASSLVYLLNDLFAKFHLNYSIDYDFIQQTLANMNLNSLISENKSSIIDIMLQSLGLFGLFINAITSFIMSIYMLANKETHIRQLKKIITFFLGYKRALSIFDIAAEANHYFNGFVSGQLLESCILTCLMYTGFRICQLPFSELLACIIGISSLVPMFGGFFGFGVGFILVLAVSPSQALIFTICFCIIQQFESNIIYPRVVGGAVGISGLYVLLSLVVFGNLFGFFGMLIAVPSMALIYAVGSRMVTIGLYRKNIEVTDESVKIIKNENQN